MARPEKSFKVMCSSLSDPVFSEMDMSDFGRWVKLAVHIKAYGEKGKITITFPARALCLAMQAESFSHMISMVKRLPIYKCKDALLGKITISLPGWSKDQEEIKKFKAIKYLSVFEEIWSGYPERDGRKKALLCFSSSVDTERDCKDIRSALRNYKDHLDAHEWKRPKLGSTWFNNWRDWIDKTEPSIRRKEEDF